MKLHYQTVSNDLKEILLYLMEVKELNSFRLVGGTALSLQVGHRISVDIDLFTDAQYGTIDFQQIEMILKAQYSYFFGSTTGLPGFGKSYSLGNDRESSIKLDLYYTDPFIDSPLIVDGIRMASTKEIIAMKVDVISRGGRKKDFWDLHELLPKVSINEMIKLHEQRYPYNHDASRIRKQFLKFDEADDDFDPICLRGNVWELIKLDLNDLFS